MEKMLVTQALDERDLFVKKIIGKIKGADFITTIRNNKEKVQNGQAIRKEFEERAKAQFQQMEDLIARYQRLDAAIIYSNATTLIEVDGKPYSVVAAIALRVAELQNQKLQSIAETMRNSILGKDSKGKEDAPLAVVETYVRENTYELVIPILLILLLVLLTACDTKGSSKGRAKFEIKGYCLWKSIPLY